MPADSGAPVPATSDRIEIRRYRAGDEAAILDLFERSFHRQRDLAHWEWKYRRDPYGAEHISLAFDASRLAGHYAGYPVPFRVAGRDVIAHQIGDTMTDPNVRHVGRGPTSVLGRTALHFYETFCEGQVAFNFGFNVSNIQKFSMRFLRSDRVFSIVYRVRPAPLPRIGRVERWMRGYQLEVVREMTPEFDELFARVGDDYHFLVRRDAQYLRWRYLDCPDIPYVIVAIRKWRRLVGWVVYRIRDTRFTWGDALFDRRHPEAVSVALRHLVAAHPVDLVEGWFPHRPDWFDRILTDLGFEKRPEPQDLSLMCVPFTMADATARMRESLYYSMGDGDLF
ncbi:MAG: GNAT family N-acetyltransferase [Thermoanaerobaculia bacterium]